MKYFYCFFCLNLRRIAFCAIFSIPSSVYANTSNQPPNWPWRGINISALDGGGEDISLYRRELHINMVRLHFNSYSVKGFNRDKAIKKSFQWLDLILNDCAKLGITAVINLDFFPIGAGGELKNTPKFWSERKYQNEMIEVTAIFANHFKDRGRELAAYDVMSEPFVYLNGQARTPKQWSYFQSKLLKTIRQIDTNRWVVFAPGPGGGPDGYKSYDPPMGEHLIWGVHMYTPHSFTHQGIYNFPLGAVYPGEIGADMWNKKLLEAVLSPVLNFQEQHDGLVWVGEFSAVRWAKGSAQYLRDVTGIFNENGWGWSYFCGTGWNGWHPDFDSEFSTDQDSGEHRVGLKSERWKILKEIFLNK